MTNGSNIVSIRDIDVPFWRIVLILVKWTIALGAPPQPTPQ